MRSTDREIREAATDLLGKRPVTEQTGRNGKTVYRLYVEAAMDVAQEFYLGFVLDRRAERVVVVASAEGGMEIEQIAAERPDSIIRTSVEPAVGMQAFQAREIAFALGIDSSLVSEATKTILACYRAFRNFDATMVEVNPLVVTTQNQIKVLDAKLSFDDNALFRRPEISELQDKSQEDPREMQAADRGLSYVGLDGKIGCIINGAGLAMATMDMIKQAGGEPANFLDIGGGASPERVAKAVRLVLSDDSVQAIRTLGIHCPLVVRLSGTHGCEGRRIIAASGLPIRLTDTLSEAAERIVSAWRYSRLVNA